MSVECKNKTTRLVSLFIIHHSAFIIDFYSYLSAIIGSTFAARRAGR